MIKIEQNKNIQAYNTFGIEVFCDYFIEINTVTEFLKLIEHNIYKTTAKLVIGGGSNLLFTKKFDGIIIKNNLLGILIVSENEDEAIVKVAAGENWHNFVIWCVEKKLGGIENLSLIPGCVGASPMQNIGAYGVEIKDVFEELEAYSLINGEKITLKNKDCLFGYRESIFKNKYKNKFIITSVSFKLKKHSFINTNYGSINEELSAMKIIKPTIKDVSNAVINIRRSKLPDPKEIGNAGSFFKNPEIIKEKFEDLKKKHEKLVSYLLPNNNYKLSAGWLIEECGLKGFQKNGAAVHSKQALVLVNKNNCEGKDIFELSSYVIDAVKTKFGIILEREVNIY